ncbi:MAG: cyclodeaminase/cyclohydrolase family protein, partial [Planctomycetota bacterium]
PAPGGGAVTAAVGAIASALGHMVTSYSKGKKSLAAHAEIHETASKALANASNALLQLADEDAAAYSLVNELQKLPAEDSRRGAELPQAAQTAVDVPLSVIAVCSDVLRHLESLVGTSNHYLRSDLAIAAELTHAAASASVWNVRINVPLLEELGQGEGVIDRAEQMVRDASKRRDGIVKSISVL